MKEKSMCDTGIFFFSIFVSILLCVCAFVRTRIRVVAGGEKGEIEGDVVGWKVV